MRPSSRRSVRVRSAPSLACGRGTSSPRIHGPRLVSSRYAATSSRSASSCGAISVPSRGPRSTATIGPVSSPLSMRISVTPVSRSPARIAAGIGVAPRCRGNSDGWRFRAPCFRSSSSRRDDLPVVGEDQQLGLELLDAREGFRGAQARRRQDPLDPEFIGEPLHDRARRRDDPDQVDRLVLVQTPQALASEAATAEEDRPHARVVGAPLGHARAPVASRTSASSSLLPSTSISSSIESR